MELVYKKCADQHIVTLQKCPDTITTEKRSNIVDKNFAKFRANKLKCVDIEDWKTGQKINNIKSLYDPSFKYYIGEIIKVDNYDTNINKICAPGIHYFKTKDAAKYFNISGLEIIPDNYTGKWAQYNDDGLKLEEANYQNGFLHGEYMWRSENNNFIKTYYIDGFPEKHIEPDNNIKNMKYTTYTENIKKGRGTLQIS